MSDPIWKEEEEERYSCKEKDADADLLSLFLEKKRCMAEATGVFFYVFAGISATTVFTINQENAAFGSIFQIGKLYSSIPKKNPQKKSKKSISNQKITKLTPSPPSKHRRRIRPRHRLRHNNLRLNLRRPLQPGNHHLFRHLARFPLAQSSPLHFQSNPRSIHSRFTHDGHVSPTTVRI